MTTDELRSAFLVDKIFDSSKLTVHFTDLDRLAVAGVAPSREPVELANDKETGSEFFLARRELGIINIAAPGTVRIDGKEFPMANLDGLYVAMGSKQVTFAGEGAKFLLISCPAHTPLPTTHIKKDQATPRALGSQATANQRKIYQYIHPGGVKSCQLVMGFTDLAEGSVWNTMPPHTHSRRSEIYFYFDLKDAVVAHFMGQPQATRHLFVQNEQAVLSPNWSIHSGCGTSAYKFIWAMAGENQTFDDMDQVAKTELR